MNRADRTFDRVYLTGCVVLAAAEFGLAIWDAVDGYWWHAFSLAVLGALFAVQPWNRRAWMRSGYWRGRMSWYESMDEAVRRGMPPNDWLAAEMERDLHGPPHLTARKEHRDG